MEGLLSFATPRLFPGINSYIFSRSAKIIRDGFKQGAHVLWKMGLEDCHAQAALLAMTDSLDLWQSSFYQSETLWLHSSKNQLLS
jgi:hypothetical protein